LTEFKKWQLLQYGTNFTSTIKTDVHCNAHFQVTVGLNQVFAVLT